VTSRSIPWPVLARVAWRDLRRHRLRSALLTLAVAVPVFAVTAINVDDASRLRSYDRAADLQLGSSALAFTVDASYADRLDVGEGDLVVEVHDVERRRSDGTAEPIEVVVGDVFDGALASRFVVLDGRAPAAPDELSVPEHTARDHGVSVGDTIDVGSDPTPWSVVGVHRDRSDLGATTLVASAGSDGLGPLRSITVFTEREGVPNAPPSSQFRLSDRGMNNSAIPGIARTLPWRLAFTTLLALLAIVISTAFTLGTRKSQRDIALLRVAGADPGDVQRTLALRGTIVAGLGLLIGWASVATGLAMFRDDLRRAVIGSDVAFTVRIIDLAFVAVVVIAAGTLSAWWPARGVVGSSIPAALEGRGPAPSRTIQFPVAGVATGAVGSTLVIVGAANVSTPTLAVGIAVLVYGIARSSSCLVAIAGRLLVRSGGIGRVAGRSFDRQRTRTGPVITSIAAVCAASVVGLVALASEQLDTAAGREQSSVYAEWDETTPRTQVDAILAAMATTEAEVPAVGVFTDVEVNLLVDEPGAPSPTPWEIRTVDAAASTRLQPDVRAALLDGSVVLPWPITEPRFAVRDRGADGDQTPVDLPAVVLDVRGGLPMIDVGTLRATGLDVGRVRFYTDGRVTKGSEAAATIDELAAQEDQRRIDAIRTNSATPATITSTGEVSNPAAVRTVRVVVLGGAALFVILALSIGLGLSRLEQRDDELLLVSLGAAPGFRRRSGAIEAAVLVALGVALALPLGVALAITVRRGIAEPVTVVPWATLMLFAVALPLASAVLFGLTRRTPKHLDLRS
jgi:putative ABC transport system permease protein